MNPGNESFDFATANRIIFGENTLDELGPLAAELGTRALIVCGKSGRFLAEIESQLTVAGLRTETFRSQGEPTTETVQHGTELARKHESNLVIAIGGGSVIDCGKAISALAANPGSPLDYLEVVGKGMPLSVAPIPCIAIPTTAGTGSEVTRNAVLGVKKERVKVSLRHPLMLPRVAIIDPVLTYHLPPSITAASGMDALTQVIEPYVSSQANEFTDLFCREGMVRAARSLETAVREGLNQTARRNMAMASLYGGLALANAKLGAVHGLAGPFGGMFDAPHGAICARLLPEVMKVNVAVLLSRASDSPLLSRFKQVAEMITGEADASAQDGIIWLDSLCRRLDIPGLSSYGFTHSDMDELIKKAMRSSSMKGNPVELREDELRTILEASL
jgi:alcohol dehydrogenase class IV